MRNWSYIAIGATLLVLAGCSLAEWQAVGADAVAQAPAAVTEVISNPTPLGIAVIIATYIAGLVSKSAARGFGTAASKTATGTVSAVARLLKR